MPEPELPALGRGAAYYGLAIVTLLNFLNYIDRFILASVLPSVKIELGLTDFQLGLLANAFLVAYFVTCPFFGALGDRLSRTRLMAVGVAAWSIATAATGVMRSFGQLLMARSCVGVGEAAYATISPALLSDYFPRRQRGRAFAVFYVAIPVGAAVGFLLGGAIGRAYGWRAAFYAAGLPGVAMSLLALTAPDPPRGTVEDDGSAAVAEPVGATLIAFCRNFAYAGTVLGYAAYTFALGGLSFFLPTFLERVRGVELARADYIVGVITVLAGLSGTFLGGYLGDWLSARMKHGQLWLSGISSVAAIVPAWFALTLPSPSAVPVGARAMAMAVSIFAIHLLGDAISPPVIGKLSDVMGMAQAVLIVPVAIAISGLIWTATAAYSD